MTLHPYRAWFLPFLPHQTSNSSMPREASSTSKSKTIKAAFPILPDTVSNKLRRSKLLEDHEEISHDSRLPGEHASFPKTREHKKKRRRCHEHDTTATESGPPASDRDHSQRLAGGCACRLLGSHAGGASHTFSGEVCKQKTFPETP